MNGNQFFSNPFAARLIHAASRPGWRQKGKRVSLPKPGGATNRPDWAEHRGKPNWDGRASRILGLVLLVLIIPALLTAWVWLFPDQESTPLLVISATAYHAPAPSNAFAAEDVARMREAYGSYHNIALSEPAEAPQDSASLLSIVKSFLERAQPGGPDKNVVMIYLSAHGLVNAQGEPCLMLPDHDPFNCTTWLPVSELIEVITATPHLKECQKIILLDATRIDDAWRMGVFANTFAIALESLLSETRPANCFVVNASTGLETAFSAPELSGTAFGYFVTTGLRGEADKLGNDNGVVTLGELAEYLRDQVDRWALSHRAVHQRPSLSVAETDSQRSAQQVDLAYVTPQEKLPAEAWSPPEPADEASLWDRTEALETQRAYKQSPLSWGYVQFLIERYDEEFMAGSAYSKPAGETFREMKTLLDDINGDAKYRYPKPVSLAMQHRLHKELDAHSMAEIWDAWLKNPADVKVPVDYRLAADFAWQRLADGASQADEASLQQVLKFCEFAGGPRHEEFSEIALLRLLAAYADWKAPTMANTAANTAQIQRLIAARRESEQLAAPEDPRQHYAISRSMKQCDANLAVVFDDILTGNEASLQHAREQLDVLLGKDNNSLDHILKQSDLLRQALESRDQAFATLLPITRFVAMRGRFDESFRTRFDLATLADQALELADLIDTTIAESAQPDRKLDENRLQGLSQQIDASLDKILKWYNQRVAVILDQEEGSSRAIQLETPQLLRCPIEFGAKRHRLREKWIKQLQSSSEAERTSPDERLGSRGEGSRDDGALGEASRSDREYLNWLLTSGLKPLERLLNWQLLVGDDSLGAAPLRLPGVKQDSSAADLSKELAQLGGMLRARRREVPAACQTLVARSSKVFAKQPAFQSRRGFTLADRLTRELASLTTDRWEFAKGEPAGQLQSLDTQALMLWHGHRLLNDFWGPWQPLSEPYFAKAAEQQAEQAEGSLQAAQHGPRELRNRINASLKSLSDWSPLQTETLAHSDESMLRHEVEFKPQPDLRPGHASVYLTDDKGNLFISYDSSQHEQRRTSIDTGGGRLEQPNQNERIAHHISGNDLRDKDSLYANALFRGHAKKTPFSIGRGVSVPWQKPAPASASIVVRGDAKQISQLIFIVDCSASMGRKLEVGATALSKILDSLVQQDNQYRIGLIFYGRRAKFEAVGPGKGYAGIKPIALVEAAAMINPDADVEVAELPRLLNDAHGRSVQKKLSEARPGGQTPLYLALHTALRQFDSTTNGPRHVIAVTDGMNKLYEHPAFPAQITKSSADVENLRQQVGARIDVVEFGKEGGDRQQLREITTNSGGKFHQIDTAAKLAKELENALRLDRYYLKARADAATALPKEYHEFGSAAHLPASYLPLDFRVLLEQHTTDRAEGRVEGGEALKLVYRQSAQHRLGYERYAPDDIRDKRELKELLLATHVPAGQLNQPTFRVSVQNLNERWFSPRPEVIWAKVTPIGTSSPRSYYFVDRQFEMNLPVPMLQLPARGWSGSKLARVELSFAMTRSALEEQSFPIPAIGNEHYQVHGAALEVDSKRTRTERAGNEQLIVTVDEKHGSAAKHYPLHIQLDPQPDRIARTYFEADGRARYVFYFDVQPSNPKLLVLSRQEIEARGVGPIVFEKVELPRY